MAYGNLRSPRNVPDEEFQVLKAEVMPGVHLQSRFAVRSRNKSARDTIREWPDVRAGEIKNIFPYSGEADVLFNSALLYELAMLRPLVEDSLLDIAPEEPEYVEAQRLLRILRSVKPMTETKDITNNSIMREFLGGGIWVK